MKKRIASGAGSAAAAVATMALIGNGVAAAAPAPDVTGQKYSDATGTLSGAGYTPVVSTTVGDQKGWSDCVVASQQVRTVQPAPNSSGSATNEVLLSLNCDAPKASATSAGHSAASPEGRAAAAAAASATPTPGH